MSSSRLVVFLGPSMPLAQARRLLDADYRPPIARGDILELAPGTVVGLIDGVFHQDRAVSPRELSLALQRGIHILASSSMGALRAAEVPGIEGVGRVYEMYRTRAIARDDEVALLFDPEAYTNHTVPLVNTRYAVDRLVRCGTLDRSIGERIVEAAAGMHYAQRTYRAILRVAGLGDRADAADLAAMLASHDLKREDAQTLLEQLPAFAERARSAAPAAVSDEALAKRFDFGDDDGFHEVRVADEFPADAPLLVWELGERVELAELVTFLRLTGALWGHARNAAARYVLAGNDLEVPAEVFERLHPDAAQWQFERLRVGWGWETEEETHVTMTDLGLGLDDVSAACDDEARARAVVAHMLAEGSEGFARALRAELFSDGLALKRAVMRAASLRSLAAVGRAGGPPSDGEIDEARRVVSRCTGWTSWAVTVDKLAAEGVTRAELDAFAGELAWARRVGRQLQQGLRAPAADAGVTSSWPLRAAPKTPGDARFCLPIAEARAACEGLAEVIGITRVGMIGELSDFPVQVGQAARPGGTWSSSYGSGKSESVDGAFVGSVMEEAEKWAQERFDPGDDELRYASYDELRRSSRALDPARLGLPYDSVYAPDRVIGWYECHDLLSAERIWVPRDALASTRSKGDIYYTARGSRKAFSTNGLASGFTAEEALVHAVCEYVERHARKLAALRLENPGGVGDPRLPLVELDGSAPGLVALRRALERPGYRVLIMDITTEIAIPTYQVMIEEIESGTRTPGWATHPNPEVAVKMAMLEAAQSAIVNIAGGREDLLINARSLGRHEGAHPRQAAYWWYWADPDQHRVALRDRAGFEADDARDELRWILARVRDAGIDHVAAVDLSCDELRPARAVRVVIPDLETTNPYHTGVRGRLALLSDVVPRWYDGPPRA